MAALGNTSVGNWMSDNHLQVYGWVNAGAIVIAAAVLCAAVVGCASGSREVSLTRSLHQMHYHGGPKSPMWRG